jgi:hypothetical protein
VLLSTTMLMLVCPSIAFTNRTCVLLEPHPVVKAMALNAHNAMLRGAGFHKRITKLSLKLGLVYRH